MITGLYFVAFLLDIVGCIWLCLITYHESSRSPWMMWFFPVYELIFGLFHLRKTKYPMLILLAGILLHIYIYQMRPW